MKLKAFIKEHGEEIDRRIKNIPEFKKSYNTVLNDHTRFTWIFNTESLTQWARDMGVKI